MTQQTTRVCVDKRLSECLSIVAWDRESSILSISLSYGQGVKTQPRTLADEIGDQLGMAESNYRLVVGNVDILLDNERRMVSLDIRTNPRDWQSNPLAPITNGSQTAFVRYLADYDKNGIASIDASVRICHDLSSNQLAIQFGDCESEKWVRVADSIAAGLTLNNYLSELRLLDFELPVTV